MTSAVTHQAPVSNPGFFSTLVKPVHYITALFIPFIPEAEDSQPLIKNEYSAKSDSAWGKVVKVALMVLAIQQAASLPTAAALEWNSVADAREHYVASGCVGETGKAMEVPHQCLTEGKPFAECAALSSPGGKWLTTDLMVFTRHPSGPVSIVKINPSGTEVCYITAANENARVAKTCITDIKKLGTYTVIELPEMTMKRAYEGLKLGESARHIAFHSPAAMGPESGYSCGAFHQQSAEMSIGDEPACIVTAFGPEEEVVQTCFDLKNPTAVIVKGIENFPIEYPDDGKPFSYVTKKPASLGLDPYLDTDKKTEAKPECRC